MRRACTVAETCRNSWFWMDFWQWMEMVSAEENQSEQASNPYIIDLFFSPENKKKHPLSAMENPHERERGRERFFWGVGLLSEGNRNHPQG